MVINLDIPEATSSSFITSTALSRPDLANRGQSNLQSTSTVLPSAFCLTCPVLLIKIILKDKECSTNSIIQIRPDGDFSYMTKLIDVDN